MTFILSQGEKEKTPPKKGENLLIIRLFQPLFLKIFGPTKDFLTKVNFRLVFGTTISTKGYSNTLFG